MKYLKIYAIAVTTNLILVTNNEADYVDFQQI